MAAKVFYNFQIVGALYQTPGGREAEAGDAITIFLDQARNADFPASIPGLLQNPMMRVNVVSGGCLVEGTSYSFSYDSEDLEDASGVTLAACDITAISVTSCCEALRTDLLAETAARTAADTALQENLDEAQEDLDTWDVIVLSAEPVQGVTGVPQVETQTVVGTIATAGTTELTVTGAGITGSPLVLTFDSDAGDVPSVTAAKAAAKLASTAVVTTLYDVDNIGADFALTEIVPNGNDGTLNIAITNGTATGLTPDASSTNTTTGVAETVGTPAERLGRHAQWGDRIWEATDITPNVWVEITTEDNSVQHAYAITGLTGGGASKLDGIAVDSGDTGRAQVTAATANFGHYLHVLKAGTDAESSPGIVRPDNFDVSTNAFVWEWKPAFTDSASIVDASPGGLGAADDGKVVLYSNNGGVGITGELDIQDPGSAFYLAIQVASASLTASRIHLVANASGTGALYQTVVATTPLTGATITGTTYVDQSHYVTPAGTLAALTFTLPAAADARAGQMVKVWITQAITALTVNVSGGGTILGTAITAAAYTASTPLTYECVSTASTGTWIRRQ